jgi:hypothetical protein
MKNQLQELHQALLDNVNADWSENSPEQEFQNLANMTEKLLKEYDRKQKLHNLSLFLSTDTEEEVEKALEALEKQMEIDGSVMVDNLEDVPITQANEFRFTVKELLDSI